MHDPHRRRLALGLILLAYLAIGTLYAALTPDWQVPDEPAHYNYIRQLAAGTVPVIEPGDYDQDYQGELVTEGFPPGRSIASIQYEDHQPPLYYLLATPVFMLFGGALLPLRLFSMLLGAGIILVTYRIGRLLFPSRPLVTLTAVALVAFIPQHIAMMTGVNNDSLAELLLAVALLGTLSILKTERPPSPWLMGLLLGAIFITKIQAYVAAPVLGIAVLIRWRRESKSVGWLFQWALGLFGLALLIGAFWWGRNIATYSGMDWMGLGQHDLIVTGQPGTAGWIADHGFPATLRRFLKFTFQSFWGMFGWMAVPMNARVYQGLGIWTALTAWGFGLALFGQRGIKTMVRANRSVGLLLVLSAALTSSGYLWWNLSYVQHQGRYLFPALIPLGLAAGLAWEELIAVRTARVTAGVSLLVAIGMVAMGNRFFAVLWVGAAGLLWINSLFPGRVRWLLPAIVGIGLAALSLASLFLFVVPWLN